MKQTSHALIFQPTKNPMQSGRGKTKQWLLKFERPAPGTPDALMGWNTMPSTQPQVQLSFASKEEAIAYANAKNLTYTVKEPKKQDIPPKAYAENFAFTRRSAFDKNA